MKKFLNNVLLLALSVAAGFLYWPRQEQWSADLRYVQQVEGKSGLLAAGWCLLGTPWLLLRHVFGAFRPTCWREWVERVSPPEGCWLLA